jgi:HEAT repeat protein
MLVHHALKDFPAESLYKFAKDKDEIVRTLAAAHLMSKRRLGEKTFAFAVNAAKAEKAHYREIGAYILGQLCYPDYPFKKRSVPILEKLSKDSNANVRAAAIAALGHLEVSSAERLIARALKDADPGVVLCATFAIYCLKVTGKYERRVREVVARFGKKTRNHIERYLED